MPQFAVIIPAAGRSTRFGSDKLAQSLRGRTVLQRTLDAFLQRSDVAGIYLVGRKPDSPAPSIVSCPGGPTRAHSVHNGLHRVPEAVEWVAVHDAARPLVSQALIDRTLAAAVEHGAAVPALPVHLTIKRASAPLPAPVIQTIPRQELWAMQTPQIMRRRDLMDAFDNCPIPLEQVTDDVQLLELAGKSVWLIPGDERNLKITTPLDVRLAELLLDEQSPAAGGSNRP